MKLFQWMQRKIVLYKIDYHMYKLRKRAEKSNSEVFKTYAKDMFKRYEWLKKEFEEINYD